MIGHWEKMERREEEVREKHDSERGRRRSSNKMREIFEVFEVGRYLKRGEGEVDIIIIANSTGETEYYQV